ncbi:iron ABC transporter permease [Psychrobium sp. 1_MG-2023]|uniref:FecCD family ABC transporter permease n=1 Tax=Psychrobium sp. 1_MG-2023 TaxID=3062624 RepID=UPI000C32E068|nr:iron ABC transporter permease [Psychrobium sp. 1_MG-2023]MDP2559712.1 iron ABC transporter permease [Psychrobium sp. 1_MG-2023]PKF59541.1 ABC transporter permease [Alteromonadales bacterium alter-6D02]
MKSQLFIIPGLMLTLLVSALIALSHGAISISLNDVFSALLSPFFEQQLNPIYQQIVLELRLPRIILAFLAGAGLAVSGAILQLVTRNPLADPYLFGISAGASFGAVMMLTILNHISMILLPAAAFVGGLLSVFMVVSIAGRSAYNQVERMLLAGVATSFMFSAASSAMLYNSDPQAAASILFWTLGSFAQAQWDTLLAPAIIICSSIVVFFAFSRHVVAISSGDESATTLGVNVSRVRLSMLIISSLICSVIVASAGGIAFVGLLIPHAIRLIFGQHQLNNYFLVALTGGLFMIYIDLLARTLIENQEIPLGIITSAIGSVFFLFILKQRTQRNH